MRKATRPVPIAARTRGRGIRRLTGPASSSTRGGRAIGAAAAAGTGGVRALEVALAQPGAALGDGVVAAPARLAHGADRLGHGPDRLAGRLRPSETSATITGVIAAPNRVPPPHSLETTSAAASEDRLAIINVVTERPGLAC